MFENHFKTFIPIMLTMILLTIFLVGCNPEKDFNDNVESTPTDLSDEYSGEELFQNKKEISIDEDQLIAESYVYKLKQPTNHNQKLEDERYNLKAIENVRAIGMITGEGSENRTRSTYQVGGTDLGIFIEHKDKMYLFFGDTFRGDDKGNPMEGGAWRCNVLAYTTDFDASDGITFDGMITTKKSSSQKGLYAKELIPAQKIPGVEHTVIPTGGFSDGENLYTYFMSVKQWGGPGEWVINYGGLAKSTDDGESFKKLSNIKFDGDKFGQIAPLKAGDYLYCVGIPGGRFGSAKLMRVKMDSVEDFNEYEYFVGLDDEKPTFQKGYQNMEKL